MFVASNVLHVASALLVIAWAPACENSMHEPGRVSSVRPPFFDSLDAACREVTGHGLSPGDWTCQCESEAGASVFVADARRCVAPEIAETQCSTRDGGFATKLQDADDTAWKACVHGAVRVPL